MSTDDGLQYLLSKLQSDDGWSCANLAWNKDRLTVIVDQWSNFDGGVKSKLLLSFLSMSPRVINNCKDEMFKLLRLARRDGDEWVRLLASVLATFPTDQYISLNDDYNTSDILSQLSDILISSNIVLHSIPQVFPYLSQTVLNSYIHYNHTVSNHFTLGQAPRASTQLRTEVLHRAEIDFAQTGSLIRDRILHRQSSSGASGVGVASSSKMNIYTNNTVQKTGIIKTGLMQRRHRQKGTKLLEIDEVPLAGSNRRKRKSSVLDVDTPNKKVATPTLSISLNTPMTPSIQATPTPDYAAALGGNDDNYNIPVTMTTSNIQSSFSNEVIQSILSLPTNSTTTPTPPTTNQLQSQSSNTDSEQNTVTTPTVAAASRNVMEERQRLLQQMQDNTSPQTTPTTTSATTVPTVNKQPNRLKLTRQQLAVAQEIFREAPHLNKQQKALILAFMAGSRDNPLPSHNIISLKLSSKQQEENIGDTTRLVQLETVFEMNYTTGQWRKLQVKRPLPNNMTSS